MLCLKCQNERFKEDVVKVDQVFRGEEFTANSKAMVCTHCGWFTMTDKQADKLSIQVADEYRRKHGLLTTSDLVAARKARSMSQREFAKFLGVGEASVKRWETGTVQERVYDDLIRRKCGIGIGGGWGCIGYSVPAATFSANKSNVTSTARGRGRALTRAERQYATSRKVALHIKLSDGNPWRAEHLAANDPFFTTTA